jgi:capsular polysaccharide transport system permease protein
LLPTRLSHFGLICGVLSGSGEEGSDVKAATRASHNIQTSARVILALMLRDMRTRFGGTFLSYLVAIAWPLSHLALMVITFIMVNRMLPFGTDSVVYIASGALPYILCMYPARLSSTVFLANRPLLQFPLIRPIHIILARVMLEALSACIVCIIFSMTLWMLDVDIVPADPTLALTSIYASVLLGMCLGVVMTVVTGMFGVVGHLVFIGITIILYLSAGVVVPIPPGNETLEYLRSFNPMYHLVQWTRSAYYEDAYPVIPLSRSYVIAFSAAVLLLGLLSERLFRGKIMK